MTDNNRPANSLYSEIEALGGVGPDEWSRGYNDGLADVLELLAKRGFTAIEKIGRVKLAVHKHLTPPFCSADWLAMEVMTILETGAANDDR